jgi:hypothetical protein
MNWDLVTRILLPILTFALGVISTWLFKRYDDRRTLIRRHTEEVSKLVNEWYNQIHEISNVIKTSIDDQALRQKIDSYIENRLVLPKLILSLEILKCYSEAEVLVKEVEGFLNLVTETSKNGLSNFACVNLLQNRIRQRHTDISLRCKEVSLSMYDLPLMSSDVKKLSVENLQNVLQQLDNRLQEISRISAEILAGRKSKRKIKSNKIRY